MPQYFPGSEAFVDAVLERENSKYKDEIYCTMPEYDTNIISQYNWTGSFTYLCWTQSLLGTFHEKNSNCIGQWRPKSFKPKYYETSGTLESK